MARKSVPTAVRKDALSATVDVAAKATASAEAKLINERKKYTTENIPEDVSRAKASAWLTLISPLTEWAGLKGDQLRHKRELLRIYQDHTLNDIAERARAKIGPLPKAAAPAPLKFMIPFLEKASIEGTDEQLRELWASLLASAYKDFRPQYVHFCSVISQLSASQARALSEMIGNVSSHELELAMDHIRTSHIQGHARPNLVEHFDDLPGKPSAKKLAAALDDWVNRTGLALVSALVDMPGGGMHVLTPQEEGFRDEREVDYNILEAIGLIELVEVDWFEYKRWGVTCTYYALTPLGFYFATSCGLTH